MLILGLLGMYFDAAVLFVTSQTLLFRLVLAILCLANFASLSWKLDNPYYHEQPGLESDPSSAISGLPGNVNLELLQQATSYLNSGIAGSGSDAGSAVNEDPGFHEHVNSLRDTMFYVCQV